MKFRKKPVIVEALQFKDDAKFLSKLSVLIGKTIKVNYKNKRTPILKIKTLEGIMSAKIGDWIIRGVKGEFYPCKPDIFKETYDKVEEV